jgi:hypothetical protein
VLTASSWGCTCTRVWLSRSIARGSKAVLPRCGRTHGVRPQAAISHRRGDRKRHIVVAAPGSTAHAARRSRPAGWLPGWRPSHRGKTSGGRGHEHP